MELVEKEEMEVGSGAGGVAEEVDTEYEERGLNIGCLNKNFLIETRL